MSRLLFKDWLLNEVADYGFSSGASKSVRGGTMPMQGNEIFHSINVNQIIGELANMPALGQMQPYQSWAETVQYGNGVGAFKINISPLGSLKAISRRLTTDLLGETVWICKHIFPLCDNKDQNRESEIAGLIYNYLTELSQKEIEGPLREYDTKNLAWNLWQGAKKHHPGYIMFPVKLKEMDENYFKLVFEFRGQGIGLPSGGRAEQFDIDLKYDKNRGLIRCWGYDIDSTFRKRKWEVQPPEWDEWFSPAQDTNEIIENVLACFLQY